MYISQVGSFVADTKPSMHVPFRRRGCWTERHIHDIGDRFIFRAYTDFELTGIALHNGGSSSEYAIGLMQSWVQDHRAFHERADLRTAHTRVTFRQAASPVEQDNQDSVELDKGDKDEDDE